MPEMVPSPAIRTAESLYFGDNADVVPEMVASPALEQQNHNIMGIMLM